MAKHSKEEIVKNFIQLYKYLIYSLPHLAVHNFRCENSDYSDQLNDSINAYVCFNGYGLEDCYYLTDSRFSKDCVDMTYSNKCELCYECIDCEECYNSDFCRDCERCRDLKWCFDCFGCKNCFGCIALKGKEFYIFNEKYSKDEYEKKLKEVEKMPMGNLLEKLKELSYRCPMLAVKIRKCENCSGNYVYDSKNSNFVFKGHGLEDSVYITDSDKLKDCADADMSFKSELLYEAIEDTDNYNCNFMYWCATCHDCEYVMYCFDCKNCFGCFNLHHKKYMILNKEYGKDEYFELVDAIKVELREMRNYKNFLPDIV